MLMLAQFFVAATVSVCNITIHALVMTLVVRVAQKGRAGPFTSPSLRLIVTMVATVSVLMAAHVSEVIVWAMAYEMVGAVPSGDSAVYFAFVNYTTLGYGDIIPVKAWQLLGPAAAMNGILLFGWSTAVIFEVLRRAIARSAASLR
jgi:Ion channel